MRASASVAAAALVLTAGSVLANNLTLSNVAVSPRNGATATVAFDIAWDHSWRFATVNHDAAWVFFKAQTQGGTAWTNHLVLSGTGTNPAGFSTGTGSSLELIVPPDGMGLFVRRAADGSGAIAAQGVKVVFDLAASGLATTDAVKPQAMGVEMVYVAEGNFKVGSGAQEIGAFTDGARTSGNTIPLAITSEGELTVANTAGNLWGISSTGGSTIGDPGTLPAAFPKGYGGFYCMKHEISEGAWVDFFNTLTAAQKPLRDITQGPTYDQTGKNTDAVTNRNTVAWSTGDATTAAPDRACSFLLWTDVCAFADWAGLRPMTELEFEKACRGPSNPVGSERPWGTTANVTTTALNNDGTAQETAANGNVNYDYCTPDGPFRAGIYATEDNLSRVNAGATYWGILDLGGSVWDRTVSVGHADGRAFTGLHGDGRLTGDGKADTEYWPGTGVGIGANYTANGAGARGGSWYSSGTDRLRVADRNGGADGFNRRTRQHGGRAVRTAPFSGAVAQEEVTGSTDRFKGGPYDGWGSSVALDYASLAAPGTLVLLR